MDTETNAPEKEDPPSAASKKPASSFAGKRRVLLVSSQSLQQGQSTDSGKRDGTTGEKVTPIVEDRQTAMKHFNLSYKYWKKSSYEDALVECDKVIEFAPDWSEAHNLRGVILDDMDKPDQAILEYREAVRLDPNNTEVHEILAYYESKKNLQVPPVGTQIDQSPVTLRRFALEASTLVTFLFIVGTVWLLVSVFTSSDYASSGAKLFIALIAGFFSWMSIRLFFDFYRSKDMSKRKLAGELMNFWGFLWIGIGVGGFVLGAGYAILEPIFKNALITNFSKIISVVGILVIGAWIYWAIKTFLGK